MARTSYSSFKQVALKESFLAEQYNPHSVNYVKYLNNCFGRDEGVSKRGFVSYYQFRPQLMNLSAKDLQKFKDF